jgi:putative ABC transport system permease protein
MQAMKSLPSFIRDLILWRIAMLKNYVKIAVRNFMKHRLYSFINVFGLAIGLAACLMIYLWVQDELSYDRFHRNADRIYRVERLVNFRDIHGQVPITSPAYGPGMVSDYPEITNFVRVLRNELSVKDHRNVVRKQDVIFTDNTVFEVFDFDLEEGDTGNALIQPLSVVLTRENARKYLGTEDVVGKSLIIEWNEQFMDFRISGILKEVPHNSHVRFGMLLSISSLPEDMLNNWLSNFIYTYILVDEGVAVEDLEKKFPDLLTKHMAAAAVAILGPEADINDIFKIKLKSLLDIHLHPSDQFEIEPQGSLTSIYIFSASAVLILLIACINFMNLSTARANKRAREVGLRKTIGAYRVQLWGQFLGESLLMAFSALVIAVMLILVFLPVFNAISGKTLSGFMLYRSGNWLSLIAITLITGLAAGLYPALYLTAFEPVVVLKGSAVSGTGKSILRRITAVVQFVISIALIIGTLTIYSQMFYIRNRSLGFDKENVAIVSAESRAVQQNVEAFRNALKADTRIVSVASSSHSPVSDAFSDTIFRRDGTDDVFNMIYIHTDFDFTDTYRLNVIHGRSYSRDFGTDAEGAVLLNQAAAEEMGYDPEEAVGKKLYMLRNILGDQEEYRELTIVGIVENFHFKTLHMKIEPLVLICPPEFNSIIAVRMMPGDVRRTVGFIQQKWEEVFPDEQFDYSFLDNRLNLMYESEGRMRDIFLIFSILSIFVACLGLFGLAAFTAEERTKEIGIRKTLGASSSNIVLLLSREFIKWVLLANIVAWPLAYYGMNRWLQNFAYRIDIGIWIFLLSAAITLVVALITAGLQSVKAALANPVDSLKYE